MVTVNIMVVSLSTNIVERKKMFSKICQILFKLQCLLKRVLKLPRQYASIAALTFLSNQTYIYRALANMIEKIPKNTKHGGHLI